ncbi:hypothetical protein B0A49_05569 [Cryomyces minteri]|uniref:Uncharacterized protein n=1 Tax=Cryomyces minteri TaxID=331657 RepID=A0A4V5NGY2_9PEZI|nr:hypothetical protein B0A49_05569 [Cryomyces minteri]
MDITGSRAAEEAKEQTGQRDAGVGDAGNVATDFDKAIATTTNVVSTKDEKDGRKDEPSGTIEDQGESHINPAGESRDAPITGIKDDEELRASEGPEDKDEANSDGSDNPWDSVYDDPMVTDIPAPAENDQALTPEGQDTTYADQLFEDDAEREQEEEEEAHKNDLASKWSPSSSEGEASPTSPVLSDQPDGWLGPPPRTYQVDDDFITHNGRTYKWGRRKQTEDKRIPRRPSKLSISQLVDDIEAESVSNRTPRWADASEEDEDEDLNAWIADNQKWPSLRTPDTKPPSTEPSPTIDTADGGKCDSAPLRPTTPRRSTLGNTAKVNALVPAFNSRFPPARPPRDDEDHSELLAQLDVDPAKLLAAIAKVTASPSALLSVAPEESATSSTPTTTPVTLTTPTTRHQIGEEGYLKRRGALSDEDARERLLQQGLAIIEERERSGEAIEPELLLRDRQRLKAMLQECHQHRAYLQQELVERQQTAMDLVRALEELQQMANRQHDDLDELEIRNRHLEETIKKLKDDSALSNTTHWSAGTFRQLAEHIEAYINGVQQSEDQRPPVELVAQIIEYLSSNMSFSSVCKELYSFGLKFKMELLAQSIINSGLAHGLELIDGSVRRRHTDTDTSALLREIEAARARESDLRQAHEKLRQEMKRLEKDLGEADSRIMAITDTFDFEKGELLRENEALSLAAAALDESKATTREVQEELEQCKTRTQQLQQEKNTELRRNKELQNQTAKLRANRSHDADLGSITLEAQTKLQEALAAKEQALQAAAKATSERAELEDKLDECARAGSALLAEKKKLQETLREREETQPSTEFQTALENMKKALQEKTDEVVERNEHLATLDAQLRRCECDDLRKKIKSLEAQLASLQMARKETLSPEFGDWLSNLGSGINFKPSVEKAEPETGKPEITSEPVNNNINVDEPAPEPQSESEASKFDDSIPSSISNSFLPAAPLRLPAYGRQRHAPDRQAYYDNMLREMREKRKEELAREMMMASEREARWAAISGWKPAQMRMDGRVAGFAVVV